MQNGIGLSQHHAGRNVCLDDRVQDAARRGHNQSGWYAVTGDITDHQPQPSICKGEEVVEDEQKEAKEAEERIES